MIPMHSSCTIDKHFSIVKCLPIEDDIYELITTNYKISINLATLDEGLELENAYFVHNTNFHKLVFFVENVLQDSVMVSVPHMVQSQSLWVNLINPIILVPDFIDSQFTEILHSKFNTITPGSVIDHITLVDISQDVQYNYVENEYRLPEQKELLGELSINNEWWWQRDDISTFDGVAKDEEDRKIAREHGISEQATKPWKEIEQAMSETFLPQEQKPEQAEIVNIKDIKKSWKPKII